MRAKVKNNEARPLSVLLVEDDPADQALIRRGLAEGKIDTELRIVEDGEQALDCLFRRGAYADPVRPLPDLVLLDLNLPRVSGREVLKQLKADDELRRIPVIVLTTSEHERDVLQSFHAGADAYIVKPNGIDQFTEMIQSVVQFGVRTQAARTRTSGYADT